MKEKHQLQSRKLAWVTGVEGPIDDPYHYDEFTVTTKFSTDVYGTVYIWERNITLHLGLLVYLKSGDKVIAKEGRGHDTEERIVELFEFMTGFTPTSFEKAYVRSNFTCPNCGNRKHFRDQGGHPGESLVLCDVCDSVVTSLFNEREII